MGKKSFLVVLAVVTLLMGMVSPAAAVTDGELDGTGHPYVGLMVAQKADGTPLWRCSGTLLSPTLFLTAGHCTEAPAAHVELWSAADVEAGIPANGYPTKGEVGGTPYTHPQYNPQAFYLYDLGVVVLDKPVRLSRYGALPQLNELDRLAEKRGQQDRTFTAVGEPFWREAGVAQRITLKIQPALQTLDELALAEGGRRGFDFAFIDADTYPEPVTQKRQRQR